MEPNFFLIGAPKSGTTALSEYLRSHPEVLFSNPKEPYFFNDDFSSRDVHSFDRYLKCFSHGHGREKRVGEGSVFCLASRTAVANILARYPDAQFIVMLRNPIDAVYAWHWQAMYSFGEDVEDFETAWRRQEQRSYGEAIPPRNRIREALQYGQLFSYGEQLDRLFSTVTREQVLVHIYDDFKFDPATAYQQTLEFLSLRRHDLDTYPYINSSRRFRWKILKDLTFHGSAVKSALPIQKSFGLISRIQRWNTVFEERPPLDSAFRSELFEYFRKDIDRTAQLLERDLSSWSEQTKTF